jgi:hypothetical protein
MDLCSVYLGDRLDLYRALDRAGSATAGELTGAIGTDERYALEWLEQQAVAGFISVDDVAAAAETRRCSRSAGYAEVLVDPDKLAYLVPFAQLGVGVTRVLPTLLEAFRIGQAFRGPPSAQRRGRDRRGRTSRRSSAYVGRNGSRRSPISMPGCSPIPLRGWPTSPAEPAGRRSPSRVPTPRFAWMDPRFVILLFALSVATLDEASVELARANVVRAGVDRGTVTVRDAADPAFAGRYDLATIFEALTTRRSRCPCSAPFAGCARPAAALW